MNKWNSISLNKNFVFIIVEGMFWEFLSRSQGLGHESQNFKSKISFWTENLYKNWTLRFKAVLDPARSFCIP